MAEKLKVLFLCTGNSCRSQMAEGLCRSLRGDWIDVWSAGIEKHGMNPYAIEAMAEIGIDITSQYSKTLDELDGVRFDHVVTVCSHANESCPVFPQASIVTHVGFDDPPKLAEGCITDEEKMVHYRRVRDEIRNYIESLPLALDVDTDQ